MPYVLIGNNTAYDIERDGKAFMHDVRTSYYVVKSGNDMVPSCEMNMTAR
jgi:hypothetical protein